METPRRIFSSHFSYRKFALGNETRNSWKRENRNLDFIETLHNSNVFCRAPFGYLGMYLKHLFEWQSASILIRRHVLQRRSGSTFLAKVWGSDQNAHLLSVIIRVFLACLEDLTLVVHITKTCLFKYTENFTTKNWKFSDKSSDIFHISAQNIDYGYSLEPPRRGGSNEYPQSMFMSRKEKNNVPL